MSSSDGDGRPRANTSLTDDDSVVTDIITDVVGKDVAATLPLAARAHSAPAAPTKPLYNAEVVIQDVKVCAVMMFLVMIRFHAV